MEVFDLNCYINTLQRVESGGMKPAIRTFLSNCVSPLAEAIPVVCALGCTFRRHDQCNHHPAKPACFQIKLKTFFSSMN